MSAIAAHPNQLGIGIDEDTCALFEADQIMHVIGKSTVTIVDPGEMSYTNQYYVDSNSPLSVHDLRVHVLSHGDRFDLNKRSTIPPEHFHVWSDPSTITQD